MAGRKKSFAILRAKTEKIKSLKITIYRDAKGRFAPPPKTARQKKRVKPQVVKVNRFSSGVFAPKEFTQKRVKEVFSQVKPLKKKIPNYEKLFKGIQTKFSLSDDETKLIIAERVQEWKELGRPGDFTLYPENGREVDEAIEKQNSSRKFSPRTERKKLRVREFKPQPPAKGFRKIRPRQVGPSL